jgi:AraC family transcriptional regulator
MMQVNWKHDIAKRPPILFKRDACWDHFCVRHLRVLAGELPEHTTKVNEVNLTLEGVLYTQRQSSTGKRRCDSANHESMCLMPFGQSLSANWQNGFEYLSVEFSPNHLSQMALEMNLSPQIELKEVVSVKRDLLIQQLGLAFLEEAEKKEASSRLYSESIAHTLMFHLIKNYTTADFREKVFAGGLSGNKLRRVTDFINDNLEQDLTLTEIAQVAELSHFHFARAFRKTMGITPQQYITNRRIEKAKELLAKSNLPIVEVGFQTGFKNQSHFTTLFRKFTSLTPKLWREVKQT